MRRDERPSRGASTRTAMQNPTTLRFVARRMTARAEVGLVFASALVGLAAERTAVCLTALCRPDDRTVTRFVAAFDRNLVHYGQGFGAEGLLEISTLTISAAGSLPPVKFA